MDPSADNVALSSDFTDKQSDLEIHCLYMFEETFSCNVSHIISNRSEINTVHYLYIIDILAASVALKSDCADTRAE